MSETKQTNSRPAAAKARPSAQKRQTGAHAGRASKGGDSRRPAGKSGLTAALGSLRAAGGKAIAGLAASRRKAPGAKPAKGRRQNLLKSRFYRVYFALVALAVILIVAGTVWLNGVLKDYESAQPIHVAQEVAKVFEDGDFAALYRLDSSAQSIANGDEAFYIQTMQDITGGKPVSWSEAFSTDKNEHRYTVTVGSDRFASFTLVPSGELTPRGNRLWKLGTLDTNVVTETELDETMGERIEYRVTAPAGYTVTVDGEPLSQTQAVKTGITLLPEDFLPEDVVQTRLTEYAFSARGEAPQVAVTDQNGAAQTLREDGENAWICGPSDDAAFRERYTDGIVKLAQQMAKFTANDISQGTMLDYVANDSPAHNLIKKFSNYWAPTHKYAEFNNMQVSDCIVWSDSCFTCHVTFDFVLRTRRGTEQTYPTAYTFCIIRKRGSALIYNLQMN